MGNVAQQTYLEMGIGNDTPVTGCSATAGYPTIIAKTAHGLKNGEVVVFSGATGDDATMLNTKKAVVKNVKANSFAVDIDTVGAAALGAAIVATPQEWEEVGEVTDMDRAAGERADIDMTHLRSTSKEYALGLQEAGTYTFSLNWLFTDAGQNALIAAESSDDTYNFRVTYPTGNTNTFEGYVKSVSGPSAGVDGKLAGSANIRIDGAITRA